MLTRYESINILFIHKTYRIYVRTPEETYNGKLSLLYACVCDYHDYFK